LTISQVGLAHGRQAKTQIGRSLAFYRAYFQEARDLPWPRALELAGRFVPYLTERHGDLLAELRGVADGACVQLEEVLALNARSEVRPEASCCQSSRTAPTCFRPQIALSSDWAGQADALDGCTAFGWNHNGRQWNGQ
jgi:hypothetical protein